MDEPKIGFGDKIFIYGHLMDIDKWYDWGLDNPTYNSVMGYVPVGGFIITPEKSKKVGACVPGFVMDFLQGDSLAVAPPFRDFVDVTNVLSLTYPMVAGTRVWMPLGFGNPL